MTVYGALEILLLLGAALLLARPLGTHMARVFDGTRTFLHPVLSPAERLFYRLCGVDESEEMRWTTYALSLVAFGAMGTLLSYLLLRLQGALPLNPQGFGAREVPPELAFNAAASYVTNTNWHDYAPESTFSHFSRLASLGVHQWTSAAAGLAVAVALIRAFAREGGVGIGNFWTDVTRATLYILLPIAVVGALVFVALGVPQTLASRAETVTLEGEAQALALGPVASFESIKHLGTNGGGFFGANSAHPFENPSPVTDFLSKLLTLLIPAALTCTFGQMVGRPRQGWAFFAAMGVLLLTGAFATAAAEGPAGGPLEGNMTQKEVRFGSQSSAIFATVATGAASGASNADHSAFTPLGALVPTLNVLSGGVAFGSVGTGLAGMLVYAILATFVAGLMVGRTPEFLGKRIERSEMRMAMLTLLVPAGVVLLSTALSSGMGMGRTGAHGFSELLYTHASAGANGGTRFGEPLPQTAYFHVTLGLAMLAGRFGSLIPILALAGSLVAKKHTAPGEGALPTHGVTFITLLVAMVLIVVLLTYFPALALGPIAEHLQATGAGGR